MKTLLSILLSTVVLTHVEAMENPWGNTEKNKTLCQQIVAVQKNVKNRILNPIVGNIAQELKKSIKEKEIQNIVLGIGHSNLIGNKQHLSKGLPWDVMNLLALTEIARSIDGKERQVIIILSDLISLDMGLEEADVRENIILYQKSIRQLMEAIKINIENYVLVCSSELAKDNEKIAIENHNYTFHQNALVEYCHYKYKTNLKIGWTTDLNREKLDNKRDELWHDSQLFEDLRNRMYYLYCNVWDPQKSPYGAYDNERVLIGQVGKEEKNLNKKINNIINSISVITEIRSDEIKKNLLQKLPE